MDFKSQKKNSKKAFEELTAKLEKENTKTYSRDERYWQITRDQAGNGSAVIRFLPPAPDDGENYNVKIIKNYTKGPGGKYYNELSRFTLGRDERDPFTEIKSKYWNMSDDDKSPSRKAARQLERKVTYHSNIYVVKDPACPENEGKVFMFSYGKTIYDKLNDVMFPPKDDFEEKAPFNPYDFWEGANFVIRVYKDGEWPSYDKSKFNSQSKLIDTKDEDADDEAMEKIWKSEYKLSDLVAPERFKSYDELKKKLNLVLELNDDGESISEKSSGTKRAHVSESLDDGPEEQVSKSAASEPDDDGDVDIEAFRKMMEES